MVTTLESKNTVSGSGTSSVDFYQNAGSKAKTVRELIDRLAEAQPESLYLVSPETAEALTFQKLQERSRLLSARLREAGLKHGDKVAFLLDNGIFAAQVFLGAMYGGLVSVPLNVNAGVSQLAYMIDHCDATVVFVSQEYVALIGDVMQQVQRQVKIIPGDSWATSEAAEANLSMSLSSGPEPEDDALLMYSSGSTGRPKGAVHSHSALLAAARNSVSAHLLTSADRSLLVLPLYHINAECVTLMPTLITGGSVVIPHRFSVSRFWDWLDEYRCTWSAVVPTIISQLLDWKDPHADNREGVFDRLRFLRSSSAPLAPSLHREFMAKFKILLIQAMGSSEAGNIFSNPLPPSENKIGSPGLPWGFDAKVINRDGAELASGDPGEILLRGPAMMRGYYKEPEATADVLDADGWLHTGDLAYRDPNGYFFVVGRSKELIIKGGVNIAPRQIDDVLEAHPAVLEAAAIGVPDHHLGEDVVAFVVLRAGVTVSEAELLKFCEGRLGHFKTPTRIHFTDDLPKGPSGKVQRLRLREEPSISSGSGSGWAKANGSAISVVENGVSPATSVHKIITDCWAEVLETSNIDANSNFFALGGHSLLAVQCLSRLREKISVALSLSDFFDNGTVAKQTALVIQRLHLDYASEGQLLTNAEVFERNLQTQIGSSDTLSSISLRDRSVPCPLSPAQRRLWFTELLGAGVPLNNESEAVRLVGKLNDDALESAFHAIIERHEVLRSTIQIINNEPFAVVNDDWRPRIKTIDLSALSPSNRQGEIERLLVEEPRRPFHLESEPGIRVTLLRLGRHEHVLILMMHHIICDWASEGIFWREISSAYHSFCHGEPVVLPVLPIQFGDYATWEAQKTVQASFEEGLDYWEDNLRGAPDLLDLPADRPRPSMFSYRGARLRLRLDPTLTAAVRELSQRTETTLFTIFVAVLNVLLHRYAGKEDVLLGIPIASRDRKDLQDLIGFLLHVQVLRTRVSGEMTFRELLSGVQKQALALYEHRAVPFEQIVNRLQPERSLSYSPIYQVMFIWRDRDQMLPFIGLEGLEIESLLSESKTSKFDLTVLGTDCGDEIWLDLEYSTDLFNEARIGRMLGHYRAILESVVSDPELPVAAVPMLTQDERKQILIDFNPTEAQLAPQCRLHDLFLQQAKQTPSAIAASFQGRDMTFRDLDRRSTQLAHHLRGLGVQPEVLVVICVERSIEMIVALIAVLKVGGAYVPMDPTYPSDRISFMLEDSGASVLITEERLADTIPTGSARVVRIDSDWPVIAQAGDSAFDDGATPDNAAYVIYTSGSTGRPKGVVIPHRAVVNFMLSMSREPGLCSNDTLVAVTTIAFDISALEILLPLTVGARIEIASREDALDPGRLATLIARSQATVMQATPATWRMLIDSGWKGDPRLKLLCGGEALSRDLASELKQRAHEVWNMYGPTETTIWSTIDRIDDDGSVLIGRPIANTQVYILDDKLKPVPLGIPGELFISGSGLARGYINQKQLTSERFYSSPFSSSRGARMYRTGDLARYHDDGRIEWLGRVDFQVKIRGFRIELGEIESALKQHSNIRECVVVAREEDPDDRRLVAYFTLTNSQLTPTAQELRKFLQQTLPDYMIPAAFVVLGVLPMTPNGKIDRKNLTSRSWEGAERDLDQHSVAPRTAQELQLLQIWQRVLGIQNIGMCDNFFDLGGHSLLAVRLVGEINKLHGVSLTVPAFFLNPTIEGASLALDKVEDAKSRPNLIRLAPPMSEGTLFFLEASIGMCRLAQLMSEGPASFATNVPMNIAALEKAIKNGAVDLPRLEDLAAPHVALIRSLQGASPCVLIAQSAGGLLAFEVAHQLLRENVRVEMIVMLDSWRVPPSFSQRLKLMSWARARWALVWRLHRMRRGIMNLAARKFESSESRQALDAVVEHVGQWTVEVPFEIRDKLYLKARQEYQWRPLATRAVLFRARENRLAPLHATDGTLGWSGLFKDGLEVVETSGDHISLIGPSHILGLSQMLKERLASLFASRRCG